MADVVEGGLNALEAGVSQVLETCRGRLSPLQFQLVQQRRDVLLQNELVDPDLIRSLSFEQLVASHLPPGAAAALKMVYPSPDPVNYVGSNPVPAGEYEAVAAPAGHPKAVVHIRTGHKQLPTTELPIVDGKVDVRPLAQAEGVRFERVAVLQGGDMNAQPNDEQFEEFRHYNVAVQPGQEVFIRAKPAGGPWLIRALLPT